MSSRLGARFTFSCGPACRTLDDSGVPHRMHERTRKRRSAAAPGWQQCRAHVRSGVCGLPDLAGLRSPDCVDRGLTEGTCRCERRGMERSVYDAVGGSAPLVRLAAAWHRRCLQVPVVSHAFSQPGCFIRGELDQHSACPIAEPVPASAAWLGPGQALCARRSVGFSPSGGCDECRFVFSGGGLRRFS